jgi:Fibronectin type III domain/Bacterial Ig-like domain (group 3)
VLITVVAALVTGVVPLFLSGAGATGAVRYPGTGLSTNYDFARLILRDGGWPVSANNVTVLTQWLRSEEPTSHWWDRDNPLNDGLGSGGGEGLGSYDSVITAAFYVAANLEQHAYGYPQIVRDLGASAPVIATDRSIWRSSWAAGHYGRGADWGTSPVPSVPSPPVSWQSPTHCPIRYPAGEVGPCGQWFTTTGTTWRSGSPGGIERQELWSFSSGVAGQDTATWDPPLATGSYQVSAFLPAAFDDANVTYVVADAVGSHRVLVDQEPFANAWAPLGTFTASGSSGIRVTLSTVSRGPRGATYVAADAVRFARTSPSLLASLAHLADTAPLAIRPAGPPQDVTSLSGNARATVAWLAPSKDGGGPISRYVVTAEPGARTCVTAVRAPGEASCIVPGLANGTPYTFVVRAVNRAGAGAVSGPSNPVRPLGVAQLRVVAVARVLQFGERIVYRALTSPSTSGGSVLFAEDGKVLRGCQNARVVLGRASCAVRLTTTSRHVILATFSGDQVLSGTQHALVVLIHRAPSAFLTGPVPGSAVDGTRVALHAWHLPGLATGSVVFTTGAVRLCVAVVTSGSAVCWAEPDLGAGLHRVVARYVGDRDFASSISRTTLQIRSAPSPAS